MNRRHAHRFRDGWCALWIYTLIGCSPAQFTTLTIYETPHSFVRLEVDRTLDHGAGHNHPSDISSEQMEMVLRGITIEEPLTRLPFYDDLSVARRHPAFNDRDIEFLAPLLSLALRKATADEIATFYRSAKASGTSREVTSGGVFLDGDQLHIVLSNLQSSTHATADIGVADTQDDRLSPMRSIAPQRGKLTFVPETARVDESPDGLSRVFHRDRRELVVLYKTLSPDQLRSVTPDP
jgi:hypothetical protein